VDLERVSFVFRPMGFDTRESVVAQLVDIESSEALVITTRYLSN
jgi:hypothetical protein